MSYQSYLNSADNMYDTIRQRVADEGARLQDKAEGGLSALETVQEGAQAVKEKADELTSSVGEQVGEFSATIDAAALGTANLAKGLRGAAKYVRRAQKSGEEAGEDAAEDVGEDVGEEVAVDDLGYPLDADVAAQADALASQYAAEADAIVGSNASAFLTGLKATSTRVLSSIRAGGYAEVAGADGAGATGSVSQSICHSM